MAVNHLRFLRGLWHHIGQVNQGRQAIYLDYPVHPASRYGWGRPAHPELHDLIASHRGRFTQVLERLAPFAAGLKAVPLKSEGEREPHWDNGYIGGLDAATLYAFPKMFGSKRYLEIGSGNSTRFVRRSIRDHGLDMRITSIDPAPRAYVDEICDEVVRSGLEDVPLECFGALAADDILMVDGSHRCFQNSDVTVVFLEILPRLRPGVLVFVHDIYLPHDYPVELRSRFYSEQYMLAVLLLADRGRRYEIVFPAHFSEQDAELGPRARSFWAGVAPTGMQLTSHGFWLRVKPDQEDRP